MKKLTRQQALDLLPLIVDNEASEDEKSAFFRYAETDSYVKKKYENLLFLKRLLKSKYKRNKAPDHLREKINDLISDLEWERESESKVDNCSSPVQKTSTNITEKKSAKSKGFLSFMKPVRYFAAVAVLLFILLVTIEFLDRTSFKTIELNESIEQIALRHFHTGKHVESSQATVEPLSVNDAVDFLEKELSHPLRMPLIDGADIRKIIYTQFVEDYRTPVLEFYQPDTDEYVHIFAFNIDELKNKNDIVRNPEAVNRCKTREDYHVQKIDGNHVVSWRWGNYWYTAVSNQNGEDLYASVKPMDTE